MSTSIKALFVAILAIFMSGCQTAHPIYYWGNYESGLYSNYSTPGKMTPTAQIVALQEDLIKAAAAGLSPNPGLHAQLGSLYLGQGDVEAARKEFEAEKALFPESSALMNRFIDKIKKGDAS